MIMLHVIVSNTASTVKVIMDGERVRNLPKIDYVIICELSSLKKYQT